MHQHYTISTTRLKGEVYLKSFPGDAIAMRIKSPLSFTAYATTNRSHNSTNPTPNTNLDDGGHDDGKDVRTAGVLRQLRDIQDVSAVVSGDGPIVMLARAIHALQY